MAYAQAAIAALKSEMLLMSSEALLQIEKLRAAENDPQRDVVPLLVESLQSPEEDVREYAAEQLRRYPSPRAVLPLLPLLKDKSPWVRIETTETLGFLRDARAVPALLEAAHDAESAVRVNVAEALGAIRLTNPPVVQTLIVMLTDSEMVVRAFAAESLGDIGDVAAIPALRDRLSDRPLVRIWVYYALARLGDGLDWKGAEQVLKRGGHAVRHQAIAVFRLLATERNAPRIIGIFQSALLRETASGLRETIEDCLRDLETGDASESAEM